MRFNERELTLYGNAASNPYQIDREGYLWKRGERASTSYRKRWFVLKGNLLFYFKSENTQVDPLGCIILERASVGLLHTKDIDDGCHFKIEFDGPASRVYFLRASDEVTCRQWIDALKFASHEYLHSQFVELRQRILALTGHDPASHANATALPTEGSAAAGKRRNSANISFRKTRANLPTAGSRASLERRYTANSKAMNLRHQRAADVTFSCKSVPLVSGDLPRTRIRCEIHHEDNWLDCGATEVISDSSYPRFATVVSVPIFDPDSGVRITVLHVPAPEKQKKRTKIFRSQSASTTEDQSAAEEIVAVVESTLRQILASSQGGDTAESAGVSSSGPSSSSSSSPASALAIVSAGGTSQHTLQAKTKEGRLFSIVVNSSVRDSSQSFLSKNPFKDAIAPDVQIAQRKRSDYPIAHAAACEASFNFDTVDAMPLRIREVMEESPFVFTIPMQLLQRFVSEDQAAIADLEALDQLLGQVETARVTELQLRKERVERYGKSISHLKEPPALTFKASVEKKNALLEMLATNLHLQNMYVTSPSQRETRYSVATTGCAAAHSLGFKHGGLLSHLIEMRKVVQDAGLPNTVNNVNNLEMIRERFDDAMSCLEDTLAGGPAHSDLLDDCTALRDCVNDLCALLATDTMRQVMVRADSARPPRGERRQGRLRLVADDLAESIQEALTRAMASVGKAKDKENPLEAVKNDLDFLEMVVESAWVEAMENLRIVQLQTQVSAQTANELIHRRDIVFSQTLTQLLTAAVATIKLNYRSPAFQRQLMDVGLLFSVSSLLSTAGDEQAMMEDMIVGLRDMRHVKIQFSTVDGHDFDPVITGNRFAYTIDLGVPAHIAAFFLPELLRHPGISVSPVLFTQGVNEMQSIANRLGDNELQQKINNSNYRYLVEYVDSFGEFVKSYPDRYHGGDADNSECKELRKSVQDVELLMGQLHTEITAKKSKNIDLLQHAETISRHLKGARVTCCKSGKDRTSMEVTLEQVNVLSAEHEMAQGWFQQALDAMRDRGTRRENVYKNIGDRRYAFNRLQVMTLPKLLRPPPNTIGALVQ